MIYHTQKGFITLISVLIVSAIGVSIATSLILLGLGSSRSGVTVRQSSQAQSFANVCAEYALKRVRDSVNFSGTGSFAVGDGNCQYSAITLSGQNRLIAATGTLQSIVRKVRISLNQITPRINVVSWQEVPD